MIHICNESKAASNAKANLNTYLPVCKCIHKYDSQCLQHIYICQIIQVNVLFHPVDTQTTSYETNRVVNRSRSVAPK